MSRAKFLTDTQNQTRGFLYSTPLTSAARNVALEHIEASGIFDYIAFVDSDDTISRSMLKSLVSEAQTRNADLVTGAFSSFDSNGKTYVKGALFPLIASLKRTIFP